MAVSRCEKAQCRALWLSVINNRELIANEQTVIQRVFKINQTHPRADCFTVLLAFFRNAIRQHFIKYPVVEVVLWRILQHRIRIRWSLIFFPESCYGQGIQVAPKAKRAVAGIEQHSALKTFARYFFEFAQTLKI